MPSHAASIENSERLQRALSVLRAHGKISSRELQELADITAPGSVVSELRANGFEITCTQQIIDGKRCFFYELAAEARK